MKEKIFMMLVALLLSVSIQAQPGGGTKGIQGYLDVVRQEEGEDIVFIYEYFIEIEEEKIDKVADAFDTALSIDGDVILAIMFMNSQVERNQNNPVFLREIDSFPVTNMYKHNGELMNEQEYKMYVKARIDVWKYNKTHKKIKYE